MKKVLALAIILATLFFGCDKPDDEEETKKSRSDLLLGTWLLTEFVSAPAIDYDRDGDTEMQLYPLLLNCEKDNLSIFEFGGIFKLDEGLTKCSATDSQLETSVWELANNGNILVLHKTESFPILQLDQSTLKVTYSDKDNNGNDITISYTFMRQ